MTEADKKAMRAEQEAKLERMLLDGLESGSSPWTKDDIEDIKQRAFQRLKKLGRSTKSGPDLTKPSNEKDN